MAQYIQPNSDIRLIFNCPLKPDFLHTIRFANSTIQKAYFDGEQNINVNGNFVNGLNGITFDHNSYQRVGSNKLKIGWSEDFIAVSGRQPVIETIFKANYMYFKNTAYENIVIYAFITDIEYINNNCCEVTYLIDPLQTWLFTSSISMPACFVERLTIDHDGVGINTVDEGLDIGNQYVENLLYEFHSDSYIVFCLANDVNSDGTSFWGFEILSLILDLTAQGIDVTTIHYNYIFKVGCSMSGLFYIGIETPVERFTEDSLKIYNAICDLINKKGKANSVLSVNVVPEFCFNAMVYQNGEYVREDMYYLFSGNIFDPGNPFNVYNKPALEEIAFQNPCNENSTNTNYRPKNKKLYQYPYNVLTVSNREGIQTDLKFEYFNIPEKNYIGFNCVGNFLSKVETFCMPNEYNTRQSVDNYEYSISGGEYGTIPFVSDTFKNWWAQNKNSVITGIVANSIANLATAGVSALSPEIGMAAQFLSQGVNPADYMQESQIKSARISGEHVGLSLGRGITSISSRLAQIADIKNKPDTLATKFSTSNIMSTLQKNGFLFTQKHIDDYHKEMLDQYFSVYGYATHKWLAPLAHLNERKNWTYIKTQNSYAKGNIPSIFLSQIQQIFDNGITFWNNPDRVGNYVSFKDNVPWLWNDEYAQY